MYNCGCHIGNITYPYGIFPFKVDVTSAEGYDEDIFDIVMVALVTFPLGFFISTFIIQKIGEMRSYAEYKKQKRAYPGVGMSYKHFFCMGNMEAEFNTSADTLKQTLPKLHDSATQLRYLFNRNEALNRYHLISIRIEQLAFECSFSLALQACYAVSPEVRKETRKVAVALANLCSEFERFLVCLHRAEAEPGKNINSIEPDVAQVNALRRALNDPLILRLIATKTGQRANNDDALSSSNLVREVHLVADDSSKAAESDTNASSKNGPMPKRDLESIFSTTEDAKHQGREDEENNEIDEVVKKVLLHIIAILDWVEAGCQDINKIKVRAFEQPLKRTCGAKRAEAKEAAGKECSTLVEVELMGVG